MQAAAVRRGETVPDSLTSDHVISIAESSVCYIIDRDAQQKQAKINLIKMVLY